VNVSDACSSGIDEGLKITLNVALLNYTGYHDTAFPGIRLRFRPEFSRDSMDARSRGATYPRDEAFPFRDRLRERRPREREERVDLDDSDRTERFPSDNGAL